jgi:hypothetical protein
MGVPEVQSGMGSVGSAMQELSRHATTPCSSTETEAAMGAPAVTEAKQGR